MSKHARPQELLVSGKYTQPTSLRRPLLHLDVGLFQTKHAVFDVAILNPPYKKFRAESRTRQLLRRLNIETSNLYTAFLSLVVLLLNDSGELIAITPRSFCNGPYFRPFRQHLLQHVNLTQVHVFEARDHAFRDDEVLQENVILHAVKGVSQQPGCQNLPEPDA